MLRLALPEEIVPNEKKFYLIDPINKNIFYLSCFSSEVDWKTIEDFLIAKRIYVKNTNQKSDSKPPINKQSRDIQSTLF